jgi:hypothetical protein
VETVQFQAQCDLDHCLEACARVEFLVDPVIPLAIKVAVKQINQVRQSDI